METTDDTLARLSRLQDEARAQFEARALSRAQAAAENRRRFPVAAEAMDRLAIFSPRLLYARQGDDEIGKRVYLDSEKERGCNPVSKNKGRKP